MTSRFCFNLDPAVCRSLCNNWLAASSAVRIAWGCVWIACLRVPLAPGQLAARRLTRRVNVNTLLILSRVSQ